MRVIVQAFRDPTASFPYGHDILSPLIPTQIKLVNRVDIFGGIGIEPTRKGVEEISHSVGFHFLERETS